MSLFCTLLFFWLYYMQIEAKTNGIVKTVFEDGKESVPTDFVLQNVKYKQFLECSHEHNFGTMENQKTTLNRHDYFLQCIELEGSAEKFVILYFNSLAIDRMTVSSCEKSDVQDSIFPPLPVNNFLDHYSVVHDYRRPALDIYFRFLKEDEQCYERLYKLENSKQKGLYELSVRKAPSVEPIRDSKCGVVKFNCRAPSKQLTEVVTEYLDYKLGIKRSWFPFTFKGSPGISGDFGGIPPTISRLLECTVPHPGPKTSDVYYELICVIAKQTSGDEFFVFVNHGGNKQFNMERFTVKSCREIEIVNAIFPGRDTNPLSETGSLKFKHSNGKCYERQYTNKEEQDYEMPKEVDCPRNILDWVNPRGSVMWGSCTGPLSTLEEVGTLYMSGFK